jgi:hypothetical protein
MSAGTPKIANCETAVSWKMPAHQAERGEAGDGGGRPDHGVLAEAVRSAVGLVSTPHGVDAAQVRGGPHVDAAIELALADVDPVDDPDQDALRERRRGSGRRSCRR